jgi:SAM-dependent methyltransferase
MRSAVKVYHSLRRTTEIVFGTRFDETIWRFRHIYKPRWAEGYIRSFSHPHRQLLIDRIAANMPFSSVLEVGCATGPNLYSLAKRFPDAHYVGVDINPEAIKQGKRFFKQQGVCNVSLLVGKADKLQRFPDKSFDIVFTDAVLMYVGPDKIGKVAEEIQRIARKTIILVEHHSKQESSLGSYIEKWWIRNYTRLFKPFSHQIRVMKIPPETWGGNWGKFGYIIEVTLPAEAAIIAEELPIHVEQGEQVVA